MAFFYRNRIGAQELAKRGCGAVIFPRTGPTRHHLRNFVKPAQMTNTDLPSLPFQELYESFPTRFRENGWYISVAATVIALQRPELIASLYNHTATLHDYASLQARRRLGARLRDVLLKEWTLVGIPVVITALAKLAEAERALDPALAIEGTNEAVEHPTPVPLSDAAIEARGTAFLQMLYQHNLEPIFSTWGSHRRTFEWVEKNVIYGLFLSDHSVLSPVESELVIIPGIMAQGLAAPAVWHLRGMRRLGVPREDVQGVVDCVKRVAQLLGVDTTSWPDADSVSEADLHTD